MWIALLIHLIPRASWAELREYTVAGESMSPALLSGDRIIVDTEGKGPLRRGDLVAVAFKGSSGPMVKRVAAIPGDSVAFRESAVWVNGERVREIDPGRWGATIRQLERFAGRVPEGNCLLLGDNARNSRDSGRLGLISLDHLKGRVVRVMKAGAQQ